MPNTLRHLTTLACAAACALTLSLAAPAAAQEHAQHDAPAATGKDLPLTPAEREIYIGTYTATGSGGHATTFRVYEEDGTLVGRPDSGEPRRMLYQGDHVFQPEGMPGLTLTFSVTDYRATKVVARSAGGVDFEGVRTR